MNHRCSSVMRCLFFKHKFPNFDFDAGRFNRALGTVFFDAHNEQTNLDSSFLFSKQIFRHSESGPEFALSNIKLKWQKLDCLCGRQSEPCSYIVFRVPLPEMKGFFSHEVLGSEGGRDSVLFHNRLGKQANTFSGGPNCTAFFHRKLRVCCF